jgi:hypothetical protein
VQRPETGNRRTETETRWLSGAEAREHKDRVGANLVFAQDSDALIKGQMVGGALFSYRNVAAMRLFVIMLYLHLSSRMHRGACYAAIDPDSIGGESVAIFFISSRRN